MGRRPGQQPRPEVRTRTGPSRDQAGRTSAALGTDSSTLPFAVATDSSNNVYVADYGNHRVQKLDSGGSYLLHLGLAGTGDGQFTIPPASRWLDSGTVYVTDYGNDRMQYFSTAGRSTASGAPGALERQSNGPIAVDVSSGGTVLVVDSVTTA